MADHVLFALLTVSTGIVLVNFFLSLLSGADVLQGSVFNHNGEEVSSNHCTFITPENWVHAIWCLIFVLGAASITVAWTDVSRKDYKNIGNENINPFSSSVVTTFFINQVLCLFSFFIWDQEKLTIAAIVEAGIFFTALYTFILLSRNLCQVSDDLSPTKLWTYRGLVQNSLAIYSAWTGFLALETVAISLIYDWNFSDQYASLVTLGILSTALLVWLITDFSYLSQHLFRYAIMHYYTLVWGLAGILSKVAQIPEDIPSNYVTAYLLVMYTVVTLLALAATLAVIKTVWTTYWHLRTSRVESTTINSTTL